MERISESDVKNRSTPASVYHGLDTLCASIGVAILLVGVTTSAVALQSPEQKSILVGCIVGVIGVSLLVTAVVLTMRSGADH